MPIQSAKLKPGVDLEKTFTLNEASYSETQMCRFKDGLIQPIGGWTYFYSSALAAPPRVILSFTDLNGDSFTAVGCDGPLYVVSGGLLQNITPIVYIENSPPEFSTTTGSDIVSVYASSATPIVGNAIVINTAVSVGGITLQGGYNILSATGGLYTIQSSSNATSNVVDGGVVATFSTTAGSTAINVLFPNHGLSIGSQFGVQVSTNVGGLTVFGNYLVDAVVDANNFTINSKTNATSTATASENGGLVQIYYYYQSLPPTLADYGYGVGGYGLGGYGEGSTFTPIAPDTVAGNWTLDHFGETLLACPGNGPIYSWTPSSGESVAQIIPGAPTVNAGIAMIPNALILMAWGSSVDGVQQPNLVNWSTDGDYTNWTPLVTNQAGGYTITTGSKIVAVVAGPNQPLLFTDVDVYAVNYLGGNAATEQLVFGFNQIAKGCGLIGKRACGILNAQFFWLSPGQFMTLSNGSVIPIPCPIWDIIWQDLDDNYLDKIIAAPNSLFNEIAWFYPSKSGGTGENDSYVKFNALENTWDYGKWDRTAWQDINAAAPLNPIAADSAGYLYLQENGLTAAGATLTWSFSSGAFMISEGDEIAFVDWVLPDFRYGLINNSGSDAPITLTIQSYRYPNDTPVESLPMVMSNTGPGEFSPRIRGRAMTISLAGSGFFRLGNLRYRSAPDGKY